MPRRIYRTACGGWATPRFAPPALTEAGPWAIGSEDDAGLTDSIGQALGVEPTVYDCDEITGGE